VGRLASGRMPVRAIPPDPVQTAEVFPLPLVGEDKGEGEVNLLKKDNNDPQNAQKAQDPQYGNQ